MTEAPYDHYISLGSNCEVAFQFRRVLQKDSSSFFSWNITNWLSLKRVLDVDFQDILHPHNIAFTHRGLYADRGHGYHYHGSFKTDDPHSEPDFQQLLDADRSKLTYLAGKFREQMATGRCALFYRPFENDGDARQNAIEVRERLLRYGENFTLVVIQHQSFDEPDWNEDGIANVYLKRYAPGDDATDGHVLSYDAIFSRFPHREGLHLAGY